MSRLIRVTLLLVLASSCSLWSDVDTSAVEARRCVANDECGSGETCIGGFCGGASEGEGEGEGCAADQELCDGACVVLAADPHNCGSCGIDCGFGVCVEGVCECSGEVVECGEACVDLAVDPDNCGECGMACDALFGECSASVCDCESPFIPCGDQYACKDTAADPRNCGGCGVRCRRVETCVAGQCQCRPELTDDDGDCVDLASDPHNCGAIGNACDRVCREGACHQSCAGLHDCEFACVDLHTDALNCGECGNRCGPNKLCVGGECQRWEPARGCDSCPCSACEGSEDTCCTYPGSDALVCIQGGSCPPP